MAPLKKGTVRYSAWANDETGRIEYSEWVLRSIQNRNGRLNAYWVEKINGLTWGKLSTKNGHFGFLNNIPKGCRSTYSVNYLPYSATKLGALKECINNLKATIKKYGEDEKGWEDSVFTDGQLLDKALRAQKRLRTSTKN